VSPVKYELGFYIPEDDILHSHRRENLISYIGWNRFQDKRVQNDKLAELCLKAARSWGLRSRQWEEDPERAQPQI
jgi:hypothetical protein